MYLEEYFSKNERAIQNDYFEFLRFASISSENEKKEEVKRCANWLQKLLEKRGFSVRRFETERHPVLLASSPPVPGAPTLLFYHHYDVQPVDPEEEWISPPFNPQSRDGVVFARGAQDNKGQCFYTLSALFALLEKEGSFPINIKILIEGEEEMGSHSLTDLLKENPEPFAADYVVIVDVGMKNRDTPALTLGARGLVAMEMTLKGSNTDLHSGVHGGIAYNPLQALCEIIASTKDAATGKILIPGFYDNIQEYSDDELSCLNFSFDEKNYEETFFCAPIGGEGAFSPLQRNWLRPTLEVNGLWGGYTGTGFKTVIPKEAHCKLSARLVPGQKAEDIAQKIENFFRSQLKRGFFLDFTKLPGDGEAVSCSPNTPFVRTFRDAIFDTFGKEPALVLAGASIPISDLLQATSGGELVFFGLGLDEDQIHAPNEHFDWERFKKGFLTIGRLVSLF